MTLLYIILFYIVTTFFAGIAIYVCKNYRNKPHFIECVIIGLLSVVLPICLFFMFVVGCICMVMEAILNLGKD